MGMKRFKIADYPTDIEDTQTGEKYPCSSYGTHMKIICDLLNEQHETIELWKGNCLDTISESQILENELDMAIEQGYEPSVPYQKYRKAKDNEIKQIFEYLQIFNEGL